MLNFQKELLAELPKTLDITRQMLALSITHLSTLEALKNAPASLDKALIKASHKIFKELKMVLPVFTGFCHSWNRQSLTDKNAKLKMLNSTL